MAKYMVFDLETETHSPFKRKANPFSEDNWVVMRGWKVQGDPRGYATYHPTKDRTTALVIPEDVTLLVGFNIKFDLLWEMAQQNKSLRRFFKRGGKIWCCQYAEYLLRGHEQSAQMVALDDIIEDYGGRRKIDEVKLLWQAGVQTSQISEALLADYLLGTHAEQRNSGDIGNTEKVFLGQIRKAMLQKQSKMIQDRMAGLMCTTEMEYNGLKIDTVCAGNRLKVLTADLREQEKTLQAYLPENLPWQFNWRSRPQVSSLIFGGTVKYQVRDHYIDEATGELARLKAEERWPLFNGEPVAPDQCTLSPNGELYRRQGKLGWQTQDTFLSGKRKGEGKFKSVRVDGELKVKWQDRLFTFDGYTVPKDEWKGAETDALGNPIYSTSGDVIEELVARTNIPFLKAYDRTNELNKEIGTYYVVRNDKGELKGMLTCVMPGIHILHHKLNHTVTITSRLSSNDPNLQNLPRVDMDSGVAKSEVKRMFISRWGANGRMLEIDYSQLEIVVQGVLSGDPHLCADLNNKIDFHCKRVAMKHNITYQQAVDWCKNGVSMPDLEAKGFVGKIERTKCKIFSFQRAYGAGAAKIALTTGMPIEEVELLIENEDLMYPGIVKFNADVESQVIQTSEPFQAMCDVKNVYRTFRKGFYTAPTGTRYSFRTYDASKFRKDQSYSPTQLKNYPVQGTGGEMVQAVLGLLFEHFAANDNYDGKALLVNTVHDCVWADCHEDVVDQVAEDMIRIMQSIPEFYNKRHGMNITVPFPVEAEVGMNMMDLEHWKKAA